MDILILKKLVEDILEKDLDKSGLLIGKPDLVTMGSTDYDFIFDYSSNLELPVSKEDLMGVPLLQGEYNDNKEEMVDLIYPLHKKGNFSIFCIRDNSSKIHETSQGKEVVNGNFLKFFDAYDSREGVIIKPRKEYSTINEAELTSRFSNWDRVKGNLNKSVYNLE